MSLDINDCYRLIISVCVIGMLFALYNLYLVSKVVLKGRDHV